MNRSLLLIVILVGATGAATLFGAQAPPAANYALDGVWQGINTRTGPRTAGPDWPVDKFTPAARKAVAEFFATYGRDAPESGSYCVHAGLPTMMISAAGYPLEIISGRKQIDILNETGNFRRIFLDGRAFPTDRPGTGTGYSVGHWEGDVLVIETRGLSERVQSRQISDEARVLERLYLADDKGEARGGIADGMQQERGGKMLVDEITIIDTKFYTEPLKFLANFRRAPDTAVLEYDCGLEFWEKALQDKVAAKDAARAQSVAK